MAKIHQVEQFRSGKTSCHGRPIVVSTRPGLIGGNSIVAAVAGEIGSYLARVQENRSESFRSRRMESAAQNLPARNRMKQSARLFIASNKRSLATVILDERAKAGTMTGQLKNGGLMA